MPSVRTFSRPRASAAIAATSAESMPPLSPTDHFGETAFPDVVARAQDQRMVNGFVFGLSAAAWMSPVSDSGIDKNQIFFKRFCLRDHLSVAPEREA